MRLPTLARLPTQCEVCRSWSAAPLCTECLARFAPPRLRCPRCGLGVGAALAACGACAVEPPPFERTVVAWDYAFPWDRLIGAFKFQQRVELAGVFAAQLVQAVRATADAAGADHPGVDLVVPVPLSPARLAERGYNQAWEVARRAARALGLEACADGLERAIDTPQQAALTRAERERNLRAAFLVPGRRRSTLQGRRVALVDDVMTTGATAREAAATLRRAGAAAIELWVLARTPAPGLAA